MRIDQENLGSLFAPRSLPRSALSGFSFLELVMTMGIIAVVLLPLLWFIRTSHQTTRLSVNEVIATNAAAELLEAIQTLPVELLSPIDGSNPANPQEGDLIKGGVLQQAFQEAVFGKASSKGFSIRVPTLPKGWNCNLIIKPLQCQSEIPAGSPTSFSDRAALARQMTLITIRITWIERGVPKNISLKTVRSRV